MKVIVNVPEKLLRGMIKEAGLKIVNLRDFRKAMKTKQFQKTIADDLLQTWEMQNDSGDLYEVVNSLFDDLVEDLPDEQQE